MTQGNRSPGFSTSSDTKQPVQPQKIARSLKIRIKEKEGLYYPSSENKGTDQLRYYCEADLRICFRIGKNLVFSCHRSNVVLCIKSSIQVTVLSSKYIVFDRKSIPIVAWYVLSKLSYINLVISDVFPTEMNS